MLCTTARAKKIVVVLTVVALTVEAINVASLYLARVQVVSHVYAIAFRVLVPATVFVINVVVVREVRRRASNANSLGLQLHHQSTSSNSAVPTIMLLTTSLVYVLLCGTSSVFYVVDQWTQNKSFSFLHQIASALTLLVFAYNFYVYLIIVNYYNDNNYTSN